MFASTLLVHPESLGAPLTVSQLFRARTQVTVPMVPWQLGLSLQITPSPG